MNELLNIQAYQKSKVEARWIQYFWIGIIIYSASYALMVVGAANSRIFAYFQLVGLLILLIAATNVFKFSFENKYLKVIFIAYYLWVAFILVRGFGFNRTFIESMIFDAYTGIFLYFVPLVILIPKEHYFLKTLFNSITILSIVYIFFVLLFIDQLLFQGANTTSQDKVEYFSKTLSIPAGYLLLTYKYQSRKTNIWSLAIILITIALAIIRARRGLLFMSSCILIFTSIAYFFSNKGNLLNRFLPIILLPFFIILFVNIYKSNKTSSFRYLTERIDEDTRRGVELYFFADMQIQDWVIGKGISGVYYCPIGVDDNIYGKADYRGGVETDYLTIILKGGLISLGLLVFAALPALILGFFFSKNLLSKAAGTWILFWMINLYPTTVTTFTMNYILVWISIGICYSKRFRNMSNESIKEYFQL